jgi:hypothetical protein
MTVASTIATMMDNSTTYQNKTAFARTNYVLRKQLNHQPRCRLVRCLTTMDAAMDGMEAASQETANNAETDLERLDRSVLQWPCELHAHARQYLERQQAHAAQNGTDRPIVLSKSKAAHTIYSFLCKRAARLARKLCRHTSLEARPWLQERPCNSLILATRYDPTATLLIYSEFIEPLTQCFRAIQENPK